jgi:anti-sigma B factor antagonist
MRTAPTMNDSTMSSDLPLTLTATWPRPNVCLIRLAGELDMATAPVLADYLREQTGPPGATHLVLDLTAVRFLASAGVALLVNAVNTDQAAGSVYLIGVTGNAHVTRVLELTGVFPVLNIHDDLDHLLEHISHR